MIKLILIKAYIIKSKARFSQTRTKTHLICSSLHCSDEWWSVDLKNFILLLQLQFFARSCNIHQSYLIVKYDQIMIKSVHDCEMFIKYDQTDTNQSIYNQIWSTIFSNKNLKNLFYYYNARFFLDHIPSINRLRVFPDYNLCVNWHDLGFAQDAGFSRGWAICQKVFLSKMGKILSIFSLKQSNWFMSFLIQLKNTQFSQNDLRHCQILEDIIKKKMTFWPLFDKFW